jgi:glycerate dehydrogenase
MKIVVLDGYTENPGDLSWEPISQFGDFTVYERTPVEEIPQRIGDAEAVFVNKAPLTAETLCACPNLRFIGVLATGFNVVDTVAAKQRGIVVSNIPAYGTPAVAQHTFGLILELCLHIGKHSDSVRQGKWQTHADWCYYDTPLTELADKTLGIIGYGDIGRRVAGIARAFGMTVLAGSRKPRDSYPDGVRYATLDEIFAQSDIITLHCPLTDENKGLISTENIAKMKDGVMIINTARGPLVDDEALATALTNGKVAAAAVDVLTQEPPRNGNPLIDAPNCILTPHMAWAPKESRARLMDMAGENLKAFIDGHPIHVVNP